MLASASSLSSSDLSLMPEMMQVGLSLQLLHRRAAGEAPGKGERGARERHCNGPRVHRVDLSASAHAAVAAARQRAASSG
jgi:hypothetical protein